MLKWKDTRSVLDDLQKYCLISSGSKNHEGVLNAQNFVKNLLEKLNFTTELKTNPKANDFSAPLLYARRDANGKAKKRIALISHADTLDGRDFDESRFAIEFTEDKIVGQGVLDDKASQFVALWGLHAFLSKNSNSNIEFHFVSSPNEELGSPGFHQFYEELGKKVDIALGFEPSMPNGDIVSSRRGNRWYDISVTGRSAHAGRRHKWGCNAAHELAIKIAKLHKLTNYRKDITLNIGEIKTSTHTYNIVTDHAQAKLDLRFSNIKSRNEAHQSILKILEKSHVTSKEDKSETQCEFKIVDDCPALHRTRDTKKFADKYLSPLRQLESNKALTDVQSGGAADVCYMYRKGLIVLDGLGATGDNMHRQDEFALIRSLESRSKAFALLLESLN